MKVFSLVLILALAIGGCGAAKQPMHPGAKNQFDSDAYGSLLVADSIIQSTKQALANNTFPPSIAPKVKESLNYIITVYDAADTSYLVYHAAVVAGNATPAQVTAVSTGLANLSSATTALVNAKAGK